MAQQQTEAARQAPLAYWQGYADGLAAVLQAEDQGWVGSDLDRRIMELQEHAGAQCAARQRAAPGDPDGLGDQLIGALTTAIRYAGNPDRMGFHPDVLLPALSALADICGALDLPGPSDAALGFGAAREFFGAAREFADALHDARGAHGEQSR